MVHSERGTHQCPGPQGRDGLTNPTFSRTGWYDRLPEIVRGEEYTMPVRSLAVFCAALMLVVSSVRSQQRDTVSYVDEPKDAVLEHIEERDEALRKAAEAKTDEILAEFKAEKEARDDAKPKLRFDLSGLEHPDNPEAFTTRQWHFPPTPQYMTGACWSFATLW